MKLPLILAAALTLAAPAKEAPSEENKATDFIRVHRTGSKALLQPAATTYQKNEVAVTLLGAVHLADKSYFHDLNTRFQAYDRVLFEMIGGDHIAAFKKLEAEGKDIAHTPLGKTYQAISTFLNLAHQKTEIHYTAKNLIHADLTMEEYQKLQKERSESLLDFALEAEKNANPAHQPTTPELTAALSSGNANQAKLLLIDSLANGDEALAGLLEPTVIITDRNAKALAVLEAQIKVGHRSLAIFYGAGHFPDMEKSLLKKGYKKTKQEWLTAWSVSLK